jgi:hypothetical protein
MSRLLVVIKFQLFMKKAATQMKIAELSLVDYRSRF